MINSIPSYKHACLILDQYSKDDLLGKQFPLLETFAVLSSKLLRYTVHFTNIVLQGTPTKAEGLDTCATNLCSSHLSVRHVHNVSVGQRGYKGSWMVSIHSEHARSARLWLGEASMA
jgi:hypothetical protein